MAREFTAAEVEHYSDPEAVAVLDRALQSVAEGRLKKRPLPLDPVKQVNKVKK